MIKILFIAPGLQSAGAETVLQKLVTNMDRTRFECRVVSLTDAGPVIGDQIQKSGINVETLGFHGGVPNPLLISAVARAIRRFQPDVIQTWLYHGDFIGLLASRLTGQVPVVWCVHSTNLDPTKSKLGTRAIVRLNAKLSVHGPAQIICCSQAACDAHTTQGYPERLMTVVSNGVDTSEFVPDPMAHQALRAELGVASDCPLIGLVARFDAVKDHANFFQAAAILHKERPDAHFVLCGSGITWENPELCHFVSDAGVAEVTHLLGLRSDTAFVSAALDISTCCSYMESFSMVLAEAMSCGVLPVTTALPGPVEVVGDCGWVVPIKDPQALANAWQDILSLSSQERAELAIRARQRIVDHFSLEGMVRGYENVYTNAHSVGTLSPSTAFARKS